MSDESPTPTLADKLLDCLEVANTREEARRLIAAALFFAPQQEPPYCFHCDGYHEQNAAAYREWLGHDRALPPGEPAPTRSLWTVTCPVCEGRGELKEAVLAWDVAGAPIPTCPHCDEGKLDLELLLSRIDPPAPTPAATSEPSADVDHARHILDAALDSVDTAKGDGDPFGTLRVVRKLVEGALAVLDGKECPSLMPDREPAAVPGIIAEHEASGDYRAEMGNFVDAVPDVPPREGAIDVFGYHRWRKGCCQRCGYMPDDCSCPPGPALPRDTESLDGADDPGGNSGAKRPRRARRRLDTSIPDDGHFYPDTMNDDDD